MKKDKSVKLKKIEKEYGVDFGEADNITLAKWLNKKGYKSLAEALKLSTQNK